MENLRTAFKTSDKLGKVVMLTGRKGGIGKTTDNDLLAIVSSQLFEKDVLLIDYDQQRNTTSNIGSTYQITSFDRSMSAAIKKGDWVSGITQVSPHLYIMALLDLKNLMNTCPKNILIVVRDHWPSLNL